MTTPYHVPETNEKMVWAMLIPALTLILGLVIALVSNWCNTRPL